MFLSSGITEKGIARLLELSADAHIARRQSTSDSPAYHKLSGMISAYGKALTLLTALHQREEFYWIVGSPERPTFHPESVLALG